MNALRFFEPGRVAVVESEKPRPGPGEVILRVHATGLCNSDVRVYLGEKKAAPGVVPGHEMAGEVAEAGEGAGLEVGQVVSVCPIRCCGRCSFCRQGFRNRCIARKTLGYDIDGGLAEFVRIPRELVAMGHLLPMDRTVPAHLRALLEPLACVLSSLDALGVGAGVPFAIVGSGPMGLMHLVAARAYGAGPILAVEPDPIRRAIALELGADMAVAPEDALNARRDLTGADGFAAVVMAVGFAEALPAALDLAGPLGRINLFAGFPPGSSHVLDLNRLHYEETRLLGTQNAPFAFYHRASQLIPRLPALDRLVTNRYTMANAAEAYAARLGREGLKSAVILQP